MPINGILIVLTRRKELAIGREVSSRILDLRSQDPVLFQMILSQSMLFWLVQMKFSSGSSNFFTVILIANCSYYVLSTGILKSVVSLYIFLLYAMARS